MAMTNYELISSLNDLIMTCKDGEKGYKTAAEGIKEGEYKSLFYSYSRERGKFAKELQEKVRSLGGDSRDSGSISASLHRGWIDIKSIVTSGDEEAIISECERGEDAAVEIYREILNRDLPADLRPIVEHQYSRVVEAHDHISALETAELVVKRKRR